MSRRQPQHPPAIASWLLSHVGRTAEIEFMRGDLDEDFQRIARDVGRWSAHRWYWRQVVSVLLADWSLRPHRHVSPERTRETREHVRIFFDTWRTAFRSAWRSRTFGLAVVGTLSLGIGANTAIFAIINAVMIAPLGYPDEDNLVMLWSDHPVRGLEGWGTSYQTFLDLREQAQTLDLAAYTLTSLNIRGADESERIGVARVSANFWNVAGVTPVFGRALSREEHTVGAPAVIVITHALWTRRFGGDPTIIGRSISLDGLPYTVIGIMPAEFALLDLVQTQGGNASPPRIEAFLQLAEFGANQQRSVRAVLPIGRVRSAFTPTEVQREMDVLFAGLGETFQVDRPWVPRVETLREQLVGDVRPALQLAIGAALLMLLLACVNVANLVLLRDSRRGSEYALRRALGASRGRLATQLMLESATLGLAGGLVGVGIAVAILRVLPSIVPTNFVLPQAFTVKPTVLLFTMVLSSVTAIVIGVIPALITTGRKAHDLIRDGARVAAPTKTLHIFVVAEVAVALMLMLGAGLLTRSFSQLLQQDIGHRTDGVVTFAVNLSEGDYPDDPSIAAYYRNFVERLAALNETERAAAISFYPPQGPTTAFRISGDSPGDSITPGAARQTAVTPDYFQVLDIPLIEGRFFTPADTENGAPVVIVSDAFARRHWGDRSPIGARISIGSWRRVLRGGTQTARVDREVVGVVGSIRETNGTPPDDVLMLYQPHAQDPWPSMTIIASTPNIGALADPVRRLAREIDPGQPVFDMQTMTSVRMRVAARERFLAWVVGGFAVLALTLSTLGIYAVISYSVHLRTREVGIRIALGARPLTILRLFLGSGSLPVALGIAIGALGGWGLVATIRSLLYETTVTDPITWATMVTVLLGVSVIATYIPAKRAVGLNAVDCLRRE